MKRMIALAAAVLLAVGISTAVTAPASAVSCTGAPNCDSGWRTVVSTAGCANCTEQVNIRVYWNPNNNSRRIYYSGSVCVNGGSCYGATEARIWVKADGGSWFLLLDDTNPPPYGSYSWIDRAPALNPGSPHTYQVREEFGGSWVFSPVVYN